MSSPDARRAAADAELRTAEPRDAAAISALIAESARGLGRSEYSVAQIEGALRGAWALDTQLIHDATYYVIEADEQIVACGGWSWRGTLFGGDQLAGRRAEALDPARDAARIRAFFVHPAWARRGLARRILERCEHEARAHGFRRAELIATLSGRPFYAALGYAAGAQRLLARTRTLDRLRRDGEGARAVTLLGRGPACYLWGVGLREPEDSNIRECSEQLRSLFSSLGHRLPSGASKAELRAFERGRSCTLPRQLWDYYSRMNGTPDYTPVELRWIRIWPIGEVCPVEEVLHAGEANRLPGFFVIADHGVSSWFYAVPFTMVDTGGPPVFRVGMDEPEEVATDFAEFLTMVVEGSSDLL